MMRENQILDGLAGIFLFRRVDGPARLQFAVRRIEDDEIVFHGHDQVVGRAALDVLHVGRQLDQFQTAAGRVDDRVTIKEARKEQPAHHPLIGHVARGGRMGSRLHGGGNGKGLRRDLGIRSDHAVREFCHFDTVDLIRERLSDLRASNRCPPGEHEIVIGIAVDVVVIARTDGSGQMCRGIEQNGEVRSSVRK